MNWMLNAIAIYALVVLWGMLFMFCASGISKMYRVVRRGNAFYVEHRVLWFWVPVGYGDPFETEDSAIKFMRWVEQGEPT